MFNITGILSGVALLFTWYMVLAVLTGPAVDFVNLCVKKYQNGEFK